MINRLTDNYVEIEYLHKLNEDHGDLKAGLLIRCTPTRERRPFYVAWNGIDNVEIPQEKITLYQKTTRVTLEEVK